jgi:lysozyme family protein
MGFEQSYERMIRHEGGYRLTDIAGDRGGQTYAGIARRPNPHWIGWDDIDAGRTPSTDLVRGFYRKQYWDKVRGDDLPEDIADSLFNFAVNAGVGTATKLAQIVAGVAPDGNLGPKSLAALSAFDPADFRIVYAVAKIKRYAEIVKRDRSQSKFLLGWINRTLEDV